MTYFVFKVTLFGQSSGGTSVFAHLGSPLSKGLFSKAWMLSASPILNKTLSDAARDNQVFLHNTGCTDINCLYRLSPQAITKAVPWDVYPYWAMGDQMDLPTLNHFDGAIAIVDGKLLSKLKIPERNISRHYRMLVYFVRGIST